MNERFTPAMMAQPVPPGGYAASRLSQSAEFELLKNRTLLRALDETPEAKLRIPIIHAAHEAAGLAWQTPFPLLVYPELFEEKVDAAREQALRQARVYRQGLESLALAQ